MLTEQEKFKRRERYRVLMQDPDYAAKARQRLKNYRQRNLEKCNQLDRNWRVNHREQYRKQKAKWREANKEKDLAAHRKSYAKHRDSVRERHKEYYRTHKAEHLARGHAWRSKNRERVKANARRQYDADPTYFKAKYLKRQMLQRAASVNLKGIREFISRVKTKELVTCYYCGNKTPSYGCHFDHIIPISKGGPHSVENLCVTCPSCNRSKHNKTLDAWVRIGQQVLAL